MKSIKITDEDKKIIEKIAKREQCFEIAVLSRAIKNYGKSKKII